MAKQMGSESSLIDLPREYDQADWLGIESFQQGLFQFIRHTATPITIALQGAWGTGKTTWLNVLKHELCDQDDAPFYGIWVNTWQFALTNSPNSPNSSQKAVIGILLFIMTQLEQFLEPHEPKRHRFKMSPTMKKWVAVLAKVAVAQLGVESSVVNDLVSAEPKNAAEADSALAQLKTEAQALMAEVTAPEHSKKRGVIILVDDLDRIDPVLAVEILEIFKNVFDFQQCIMVLAVDYNVVIKGLRPKLGELSAHNEHEFRVYFDKLIQLSFQLPVGAYDVEQFLASALQSVGFVTAEDQRRNPELISDLSKIALLSVGRNPRTLKRVANTLSLLTLIQQCQGKAQKEQASATTQLCLSKKLSFALVCIQNAYPDIYDLLCTEPDFLHWDTDHASSQNGPAPEIKTKCLSQGARSKLTNWERVLLRACQRSDYLQQNVDNLLDLFQLMADLDDGSPQLLETMRQVLMLSAVTRLNGGASDEGGAKRSYNPDQATYVFQSVEYTERDKKHDLLHDICHQYILNHKNDKLTAQQFLNAVNPPLGPEIAFTLKAYKDKMKGDPGISRLPKGLTEADAISLNGKNGSDDDKVFIVPYVRAEEMAWVLQHLGRQGYAYKAQILRHEDYTVYQFQDLAFGGKVGQFAQTSFDLVKALLTAYIAAHPEQTAADVVATLNIYPWKPELNRVLVDDPELRAKPYFDECYKELTLTNGDKILLCKKILPRDLEEYLKRFDQLGLEVKVTQRLVQV